MRLLIDVSDPDISVMTEKETQVTNQSYFRQVVYCFKSVSFVLLSICYGENY